jgi:uncharacterized protein with von Willebrand factor type A (vWA) domain
MQNNLPDWIFFDFFTKLKKEVGIELSLQQYQLFQKCLLAKPYYEIAELRHLLETLWLTKEKYKLEFDRLFDIFVAKHLISPEVFDHIENKIQEKPAENKVDLKNDIKTDSDKNVNENNSETENEFKNVIPPKPASTPNISKPNAIHHINININDTIGNQVNSEKNIIGSTFILSDFKYLPFDSRAMQQGWRKMRGKSKFIITDQLDIQNMVKTVSQQGFVGSLIYERKQKGSQKIVWFSDNGGSMAPFSFWDEQLFTIMNEVPNTEKVERYFFHDYPSERLNFKDNQDYLFYENQSHTKAKYLSEILKKTDKNTIFIIYSDGGAARKSDDMERVKVFSDVCTIIRSKSGNLRWINPVKNIEKGSAKYISFFVPTEYPSNRGISKLLQNS